jgi:hypothetical protein
VVPGHHHRDVPPQYVFNSLRCSLCGELTNNYPSHRRSPLGHLLNPSASTSSRHARWWYEWKAFDRHHQDIMMVNVDNGRLLGDGEVASSLSSVCEVRLLRAWCCNSTQARRIALSPSAVPSASPHPKANRTPIPWGVNDKD